MSTLRSITKITRHTLTCGALLGLAACAGADGGIGPAAWNVDEARALPNQGGIFDQTLQAGYADLAAMEQAEGDWSDSRHYVARTRASAMGQRPEADQISDRTLPAETVADLTAARAALDDVYARSGRILAPIATAQAQLAFDCWIQEQEENIPDQADEIATCRAAFDDAMALAQSKLAADTIALLADIDGGVGEIIVMPKDNTQAPAQTLSQPNQAVISDSQGIEAPRTLSEQDVQEIWGATLAAQPIPPKRFDLYFKSGGVELTDESLALIPAIAAEAQGRPVYEVEILGHTDTVGNAAANARLSAKRAEAIAALFVADGFKAETLSTRGFGESMPLVATGDNVNEPRNRRVEVIVR